MEIRLTKQQNKALEDIIKFAKDIDKSVFILRGYAGTGKTTLIKHLIPQLKDFGKNIILLAPTGRAAKVLQEKTGQMASTIHSRIYAFENIQSVRHDESGELIKTNHANNKKIVNKGYDDLQYWFDLRQFNSNENPSKTIFIIDESSMISSKPSNNETFHFGTDILINDLLTHAQLCHGGKIIFMGDPAQLPPVGDNQSVALDENFFLNKSIGVSSFELTEVIRQSEESIILKDATKIRNLLNSTYRNTLVFERKQGEVEDITPEQIVESYYKNNPTPQIGDAIILCFTNYNVKEYNEALRRRYFPNSEDIVSGDILQIVKNNVNYNLGLNFFNGDFVRVLEVSEEKEELSAPVWTDVSGEKKRERITMCFRDVILQSEDGRQTKCKIVDDLLKSRDSNLTPLQNIALYINFRMRHPNLNNDEKAFRSAIMNDPYINAIHAKYGYAITGHKSQGGEWDIAYVDYNGRTGLNDDSLRWAYTVTTRAKQTLYGVNMPNITPISVLKINTITKYGKPAKEAVAYAKTSDVDFLPSTVSSAQKQKCLCVEEQLNKKGYLLKSIQPCQFLDKYLIETPSGSVIFNCFYNASGLYTKYIPQSIIPENEEIIKIFENNDSIHYSFTYQPSSESFTILHKKILSICDDLDIKITNIVEHIPQYYIAYYLKTSGNFSQILFYFKGNQTITHALPSSDLGTDDEKLTKLIQALK